MTVAEAQFQLETSVPATTRGQGRYLNRELSQLDFDQRVLAMAQDSQLPLLERVRFLAILGENLDQFFQVRVAGLKEQLLVPVAQTSPDGMTTSEQLRAIHTGVQALVTEAARVLGCEVIPALKAAGISLVTPGELERS